MVSACASRDFMRDLGETIVALALVLAILGTTFEALGYNASLPIVTLTSTQSYTGTNTEVGTITSTTSYVTNLVSTKTLYTTGFFLPDEKLCFYDFRVLNLTKGQLNVAVSGAALWILSADDYVRWIGRGGTCLNPTQSDGSLTVIAGRVDVPSSGPYYFILLSQGDVRYSQTPIAPLVTISVSSLQQSQTTITVKNTKYSTEQITFSARNVTRILKPVGYGLTFYLGNGLIVAAVVALAISTINDKRSRPRSGRQFAQFTWCAVLLVRAYN
jgi:hypothetical protein